MAGASVHRYTHPKGHSLTLNTNSYGEHGFTLNTRKGNQRKGRTSREFMGALREGVVLESAPPDSDIEKWIMHRKPEFKKRYGKDYAKYLYGKAWELYKSGSKLHFDDEE
jgi:hypothetical protein